jgi:hypothetical protein
VTPAARRARRLTSFAAALAVATFAVPAVAGAADLTVRDQCFAAEQHVVVSGNSFTPDAPVTITGDVTGAALANATGIFTTEITTPAMTGLGPKTVTVTAIDSVNPANTATVRLRVVREPYGSNRPIAGRPDELTTWRFAGFAPDRPVYAHFLLDGRPRGDYRFGVARGICGTLTAHAARIPGVRALRPGHWSLKLDQRMTYRESTPGSEVTFDIRRRG